MKICITYIGPSRLLHIRRDLMESVRGSFESAGCDVIYKFNELSGDRLNILMGTTELPPQQMQKIKEEKRVRYAVFDSEVITGDTINNRKDFPMEAYVDFISGGECLIYTLPDNLPFWQKQGLRTAFYIIGYTERLKDMKLKEDREIDAFFYGLPTEYRLSVFRRLAGAGLNVVVHGYDNSPYFLRNSFIEQSKLVLNVTQGPVYNHINAMKPLYQAINGCCTVSECVVENHGGFDVLQHASDSIDHFVEDCCRIIKDKKYIEMGKEFQRIAEQDFDRRVVMEELLSQLKGL